MNLSNRIYYLYYTAVFIYSVQQIKLQTWRAERISKTVTELPIIAYREINEFLSSQLWLVFLMVKTILPTQIVNL